MLTSQRNQSVSIKHSNCLIILRIKENVINTKSNAKYIIKNRLRTGTKEEMEPNNTEPLDNLKSDNTTIQIRPVVPLGLRKRAICMQVIINQILLQEPNKNIFFAFKMAVNFYQRF